MSGSVDASSATLLLCIKGQSARSDVDLQRLQTDIRRVLPALKSVRANHCYFACLSAPLNRQESRRLLALIDGEDAPSFNPVRNDSILVVPRFGTISPWSSKATDIMNRCGLAKLERIERATYWSFEGSVLPDGEHKSRIYPMIHDRMVDSVVVHDRQLDLIFQKQMPKPVQEFSLSPDGSDGLETANRELGLALTQSELDYIRSWYEKHNRVPTDAELMMFSQVNSEHCRHKIFNASWTIDDQHCPESMFSMIRRTHQMNPSGTLVAYEDNSAVIEGHLADWFAPSVTGRKYQYTPERAHIVFKAETHNHPTAISPFPGAATGAGGEIRDEGATGRGAKPKAGLCGYSVSHLRISDFKQPWEDVYRAPDRISSALRIMLDAPIGAASFNNEFGRPNIGGYFRTFETSNRGTRTWYGFHKPIMFAGGIGNIRPSLIDKQDICAGNLLIVIGGPAMLIGLGGGAASSLGQGTSGEELDFASVQRSNPEMQRRCQEVIDRCCELGEGNPILSIHDVGAGGLSNALPEIVHASDKGAEISLNDIASDDPGMSPMEVWCNESQERYVLALSPEGLATFVALCERERCPYSVVGKVADEQTLKVFDTESHHNSNGLPVDVDMDFLMKGFLKIHRCDTRSPLTAVGHGVQELPDFSTCAQLVLRYPSVADKTFLVTIGDRTVGGLIHRDQMVGPWQVPVADAAVTLSGHVAVSGEAMAVGERPPVAIVDAVASARMAVGEALTNLRSASVDSLKSVRLSANWMAAANIEGQGSALYDSVRSVALDLCRQLEISIPVGKDSMSMQTRWVDDDGESTVISPMSLVATAFAPVRDVRRSVTPLLDAGPDTVLLLVDLGARRNRMGMSVLHQTQNLIAQPVPDVEHPGDLKSTFEAIGEMIEQGLILAYHDRSDGGLFATLCEMAFASRIGLDINIGEAVDAVEFFFNEELGVVIQVERYKIKEIMQIFDKKHIKNLIWEIGTLGHDDRITIRIQDDLIYGRARKLLHRTWSELSWRMQSLRDNPQCVIQEYDRILDVDEPGLCGYSSDSNRQVRDLSDKESLASDMVSQLASPELKLAVRPQVAIMREQGVNGHVEMAAAFDRAGFDACDVTMADLLSGEIELDRFNGMAMCGGFSFGDVLGAGKGWASAILYENRLRDMFDEFFSDTGKFALGVCNGCQVMAELKSIIPGADRWPKFMRNESRQFEARLVMVEVSAGNSVVTAGLHGLHLPVPVAHGEGRAVFGRSTAEERFDLTDQVCLRYADNRNQVTNQYPYNPNGSEYAIAAVTNSDGRITAMMPHPERVHRSVQLSWAPGHWGADTPWLRLFQNARAWLD